METRWNRPAAPVASLAASPAKGTLATAGLHAMCAVEECWSSAVDLAELELFIKSTNAARASALGLRVRILEGRHASAQKAALALGGEPEDLERLESTAKRLSAARAEWEDWLKGALVA